MSRRVLGTIFFIALANFTLSFLLTVVIGGDASAGSIQNGRYFVVGGKLNEVSATSWYLSLWQAWSLVVTYPLGLIAAYLAYRQQVRTRREL